MTSYALQGRLQNLVHADLKKLLREAVREDAEYDRDENLGHRDKKRRKKLDCGERDWAKLLKLGISCGNVCHASRIGLRAEEQSKTSVSVNVQFNLPHLHVTGCNGEEPDGFPICSIKLRQNFDVLQRMVKLVHRELGIVELDWLLKIECEGSKDVLMEVVCLVNVDLSLLSQASETYRKMLIDIAFDTKHTVDSEMFYSYFNGLQEQLGYIQLPVSGLSIDLLPFQAKTVDWMIARETQSTDVLNPYWETVRDLMGRELTLNYPLCQIASPVQLGVAQGFSKISGGVLAEEMGLGKTVEVISLILAHRSNVPSQAGTYISTLDGSRMLLKVATTLIITPYNLISQWEQEIATKAPSLLVYRYNGLASIDDNFDAGQLAQYDIVLTTYEILSKEIHHTSPTWENLNLRNKKQYTPRVSVLMQLQWFRVCIDEAQNGVGSPASSRAEVACLLARVHSWAVSGTPVGKSIDDLYGLLLFLQYPLISAKVWRRCLKRESIIKDIFQPLTCRHTKHLVRSEITLPPQHRTIFSVDLNAVEQLNYNQVFEQACAEIQVNQSGEPLAHDWSIQESVVIDAMQKWLIRLRQTCSHPQAGTWSRRAGGTMLKTMSEVLETMFEESQSAIAKIRRELWMSRLEVGQIFDFQSQSEKALAIWMEVLTEVQMQCDQKSAQIRIHSEQADGDPDGSVISAETEAVKMEFSEQNPSRPLTTQRAELRNLLDVLHQAAFLVACSYVILKDEEKEKLFYEKAEQIRREILKQSLQASSKLVQSITERSVKQDFVVIPEILHSKFSGGIQSRKVLEDLQVICDCLNEQANVLDDWRLKVINYLILPLVDQNSDPDGEEYVQSLDAQEECYSYQEGIRHIIADRGYILTGIQNLVVEVDVQYRKQLENLHTDLNNEIAKKRQELKPLTREFPDLKSIVDTFRSQVRQQGSDHDLQIRSASNWREMEAEIARQEYTRLQDIYNVQTKAHRELVKELEVFNNVYNSRIEYYRQLQIISDSVIPYEDKPEKERKTMGQLESTITSCQFKLQNAIAQHNYLGELRKWEDPNHERVCVICSSTFQYGCITKCGHIYCRDCLKTWLRERSSCPICKTYIRGKNGYQSIALSLDGIRLKAQNLGPLVQSGPISSQNIYESVDRKTLEEIKAIELKVSYGSKIDMMLRHLLWLKRREPENCKAVVFSQWKSVLDVLELALQVNDVSFVRMTRHHSKHKGLDAPTIFRTSDVQVFMLHAQSQSSGLTLINASHVFLCEPLVNPALELQGISRVHRIGQQKETFVWLYITNGTVEGNVIDISSRKRLQNITTTVTLEQDVIEDELESSETTGLQQGMQHILGRFGDGEIVSQTDAWLCLFGSDKERQQKYQELKLYARDRLSGIAAENRRLNGS